MEHAIRSDGARVAVLAILLLLAGPAHAAQNRTQDAKPTFSLEFRDANIRDVVRAVGQAAGTNVVIGDGVTGQVTVSLKNVDLWTALEAILNTHKLTYVRDGNLVRILAIADARDSDMETRVFPLAHARSQDLLPLVEKMKSDNPASKVADDPRMNAIVVRDLSLNIDRMARLIRKLDIRMPQVLIEARIVEMSTNFARDLGVQWGGRYSSTNSQGTTVISGGATGAAAQTTGNVTTGVPQIGTTTFYPKTGDVGLSGSAYVVNLPAAVGSGAGGALGFSFGKLGNKLSLDLQLSAMQTTGNGKILSTPKVMTMNNQEATISSGIDIPIRIVSSTAQTGVNTAGVQVISASLRLSATPTITQDDKISLKIVVDKSEPDFSNEVDGIPTVARRSANTQLVVNDGDTIVLGGILTKNQGETESAVPLLSKIPLIGWLFKRKSSYNTESELMIFITPTIIKS